MGKLALGAEKGAELRFLPVCSLARVQLGTEHALEMKMKRCAGVSLSRNISSPCLMLSGSLGWSHPGERFIIFNHQW
jgi:hypothetical protein